MDAFAPLWPAVRFGLLLAGLLLPGAALLFALRLPRTLATCFAVSAVVLYLTVLALQVTGAGITPPTLCAGLLVVSLAGFLIGRLGVERRVPTPLDGATNRKPEHQDTGPRFAPFTTMGPWTVLYVAFWAAVIFRAVSEPLAGPDVEFRWGFLAEQMLRAGSLDFYPPRSAADFASYFWVESIPPGASALHAWAYGCAGGPFAAWTIPGVLLQLAALHELLWHTALALVGIAYSVGRWVDTRVTAWAALAALFAILGGAAREYGLVFTALGGLALVGVKANRSAWLTFLAVASLGLVWPVRTWVLTGNPVFSLSVGGLFPVNERFLRWITYDADAFGAVLRTTSGWLDVARYGLLFAPAAIVGWVVLAVAAGRRVRAAGFALASVTAILVLWAVSVRYTNGGLFYSLRVASPALALGALAAGVGLAAWVRPSLRKQRAVAGILTVLVLALLPATLALPQNPWTGRWSNWPAFSRPAPTATGPHDATVALVLAAREKSTPADSAPASVVLADSPGFQRRFLPVGIRVIPPWSPQADWLFDLNLPQAEAVQRWRNSGIRHLVITKWQSHLDFFNQRSRWNRPPFQVHLIGETASTAVFSIRAAD